MDSTHVDNPGRVRGQEALAVPDDEADAAGAGDFDEPDPEDPEDPDFADDSDLPEDSDLVDDSDLAGDASAAGAVDDVDERLSLR